MNLKAKILLPILICLLFTVLLLVSGQWSNALNFSVSDNNYVSSQGRYQLLLMGITVISIGCSYFLNRKNFTIFFNLGQINARGEELKAFGIRAGDRWIKTGLSLTLVISSASGLFMYFQLRETGYDLSMLWGNWFWILIFALSNSFAEEMIFRLALVVPLFGQVSSGVICWVSAILFGLPHFAGMPDGIIGAAMAALLGYVLCKSMLETRGFFWAWLIHWVQDLIIMGALCMMVIS